jgi:predicted DNA-binding WGR domain protein
MLFRINPAFNEKRFYRLLLMPSLFGEVQMLREFGRIGQPGRVMIETFDSEAEAQKKMDKLSSQKLKRGYRLRLRISRG